MSRVDGRLTVHEGRGYVYNSTTLAWEAMVQPSIASTQVAISSVSGIVAVKPNDTAWVKNAGLSVNSSNELLTVGGAGGSTQVSISTGNVQTNPQSTAWVKNAGLFVDSSNALSFKLDGSTALTIGSVAATAGRLNIGSTAADNAVSAAQASTVWAIQVDGRVRAQNSTIGDLLASVQQNSTVWFTQAIIRDSSGTAYPGITGRPTTGVMALPVRGVLNDLQSTAFSTLGNGSTSSTLVSSVAGLRHKVYAYSITSTAQAINSVSFASSLANLIWTMQMQAMSSGITGANLAVTPPAWLFATEAASPLVFKVTGTTGTYHVAFSYFSEA